MPVITVTMGNEQTSNSQKKELIEKLTQEAVRITCLPERSFTILIHELAAEAIGVAGKTLKELHACNNS